MTSKAALKLAEEILDRAFRESDGEADRKIDLGFLFENLRTSLEKAEPSLDYLHSRGLIHPVTGDGLYLTARGVDAIATDKDIKEMPKYEKQWGPSGPMPSVDAAPVPQLPSRPYRPILAFVDPDGQRHTFNLEWAATVGRSDEATLKLPDPRASKRHVEIKYGGDRYILRDLGSANGTLLNGHHVDVHALSHGDVMLIGRTEVTYLCPELIPEPHGEPPPEFQTAKPKVVLPDHDPTARPAPAEPLPRAPSTSKAHSAKGEPLPALAAAALAEERKPSGRGDPDGLRIEPIRGEPIRGEPIAEKRTPSKVQVPPMAPPGNKRRTAPPVNAAAPEVPIVKGRPEAPPVIAAAGGVDLFSAPSTRERLPADLFGEPPTLAPSMEPATAPSTAGLDTGGDLFGDADTRAPARVRGKKADSLSPKGDLFAGPDDRSPADLFEAKTQAPSAPDLFAPTSDRGAPDLFAPRPDQQRVEMRADLFSDDSTTRTVEEPVLQPPPDLFGETLVRGGGVSPLPLSVPPKSKGDLLPFDESAIPFENAVELVEPADAEPEAEPARAPFGMAPSSLDALDTQATVNLPGIGRRTMPLDEPVIEAPVEASTGRTSELPAWGGDPALVSESLPSYAPPEREADREAAAAQDGFTEETTPIERDEVGSSAEAIAAAAAELPDAPMSLDDGQSGAVQPVSFGQFAETLSILRARLADAGVPDGPRLLESIELLRKHPSVRAALTEDSYS